MNIATQYLNDMLQKSYLDALKPPQGKKKSIQWRVNPDLFQCPSDPIFHPGSVNLSPGWFAQGREVKIYQFIL
jgi:hypothetical protein